MMDRLLWLLGFLSLMVLGLAGCAAPDGDGVDEGEDEEDEDPQDAPPEPPVVGLEVSTTGTFPVPVGFGFDPDRLEAVAGANVTVELHNEDMVDHAWRVEGIQDSGTGNVAGGESGSVSFIAPEPGEYVFYCPIGNHRQLGQEGTFVVTEA